MFGKRKSYEKRNKGFNILKNLFENFTIFLFSQLITTFCYCNKSKLILKGTQFTFINNTFLISVKCGQSRKKWDEFSFETPQLFLEQGVVFEQVIIEETEAMNLS